MKRICCCPAFGAGVLVCFSLLLASTQSVAQDLPRLHPLFTDHMVLQRDTPSPVWGWADPGQEVTVAIASQSATTKAAPSGRWSVQLRPLDAGGPYALKVEFSKGDQSDTVTVSDVWVGDVWICSGQSNMEWPVAATKDAQNEIASADFSKIRLFTVPKRIAVEPMETVRGKWEVCSSETVPGFSAVGYFFGRELNRTLDVPIGLIHTSWGGTVAEAWTSAEALRTMDDFHQAMESFEEMAESQRTGNDKFEAAMDRWWKENDPGTSEAWFEANASVESWKTMELPGRWEDKGLEGFDGVVWFQKQIDVPQSLADQAAVLNLGTIDDRDTTWVNGQQVGGMDEWNQNRKYSLAAGTLKPGKNVITVRVLDTGGGGGMYGERSQMQIQVEGEESISLAGSWKYQSTASMGELKPAPQQLSNNPNIVTVLYNGMLAPLLPYAIKGAIWYQGESNAGRAAQYRTLLPTMIKDWRDHFGVGDFPFLVVQLANFMAVQQQPVEPGWAELREAQSMTAKHDDQVGLAVAIDIGEANDIHPRNKQEVGRRLALSALGIAYGQDLVYSGPEFDTVEYRNGKAFVKFKHVGSGLVARGDSLKGFAIAGDDKTFVWGEAKIDGDTVIVSSPGVATPASVRYGWANNPTVNLYNQEGLPAIPFRSDTD
ncbi:sialate O-acetylesterase [Novipirellula artificiosorum]|uniref:Glycosyl hydrolases family 2, sugar binding domain n=1 Tax=Novipirellula artificiosorum TaxID=2528016 RepID=A0A5C6DJ14_9BACT|nr:sialate O-acetylesterase [Novipirellula artificiosorum]TWU36094.1 Glycosyl hydrolases family 2, sugar binding domain [Novipirellula artificiosorum]